MIDIHLNFDLFNNYYYFYERLTVLLFSLVPTILLVSYVLYTDRKNSEPKKNIIICLLSGFLTIGLAFNLENAIIPYITNNTILIYILAAIEELCKISIFLLFICDNKSYDDIYDGIVYMSLIALSFAGIENVMYAFSESTVSSSISLALMRDFTTIPLHVICGVVIGYFMSLASFSMDSKKRWINYILAFVISSLIHGTFNLAMDILSKLNIDFDSTVQVLFLNILPLLIIMVGLFYIATKFSKKTVELNEIFINNKPYEKKYCYLMNKNEYEVSANKQHRMNIRNKFNFINKDKDDV